MDNKNTRHLQLSEQIELLRSQGLIIDNENYALEALQIYGYNNLIQKYRAPYLDNCEDIKYKDNITIERIISFHDFDVFLRKHIISASLDFEDYIKNIAANVIATSFGVDHRNYLRFGNFKNKQKKENAEKYNLKGTLEKIDKHISDYGYKLYCNGVIPPWKLFGSLSFGVVANLIDKFNNKELNMMVEQVYDLDMYNLTIGQARLLLLDTIFICAEHRNNSAHGGVVYNFKCKRNLRFAQIFGKDFPYFPKSNYMQLAVLLGLINYSEPARLLDYGATNAINVHFSDFPDDVELLRTVFGYDIDNAIDVLNSISHNDSSSHNSGNIKPSPLKLRTNGLLRR